MDSHTSFVVMGGAANAGDARSFDLQTLTRSLETNYANFDEIWVDDHDLKAIMPGLKHAALYEKFLLAVQSNITVKSLKLVVNDAFGDACCPVWEALSTLTELHSLYLCPEYDRRMNFEGIRRILLGASKITLLEVEGDWNQDSDTWTARDILCFAAGLIHSVSIEKFKLSQFRAPMLGCLISLLGITTRTLREVDICPDEAGSRKEPLFEGAALCHLLRVPTLQKLTLGSFVFDSESCRCLALGFRTSQVRDLTIWKSVFPDNSAEALIDGLFSNGNLQIVGMHWNILPHEFHRHAALALQTNNSVSSFSLNILEPCRKAPSEYSTNELFWGGLSIALQVNEALRSLDLSYVRLHDQSALEIASGLRHNVTLRKLALMDCSLSCNGFISIATAVRWNAALSTLLCSGNDDVCDQCKLKALGLLQANRRLRNLGMRNWSQSYMANLDGDACVNAVKGNFGLVSLDMNLSEKQKAKTGIFLRLNKAGRGRLTENNVPYSDFVELLISVKNDLDCSFHLALDCPDLFGVTGRLGWRNRRPANPQLSPPPCCGAAAKRRRYRCEHQGKQSSH